MSRSRFEFAAHPLHGASIIESSAGTGKTYSIVQMYLRLVIEKRYSPEKILVVTFTDAATSELRSRIREGLHSLYEYLLNGRKGELELLKGYSPRDYESPELPAFVASVITSFDEASIFTIHGFCKRVLRDNAFEYNAMFNAELLQNTETLTSSITRDYLRKILYFADDETLSILDEKISFDQLNTILRRYLPKSGVSVIPDSGQKIDLKNRMSLFRAEFKKAAGKWSAASDDISNMMLENIGLFKNNIINEAKLLSAKAKWDEYFLSENNVPEPLSKYQDFFSSAKMQSSVKAASGDISRFTSHECVKAIDSYIQALNNIFSYYDFYVNLIKSKYLKYSHDELIRRKDIRNMWSFDDLIHNVRDGLFSEKGEAIAQAVRAQYPAALIDEFQDTDSVQCDIFEKIFAHNDSFLMYIGDPKQAIYSFRGADIFSYLDAKKSKTPYDKNDNWRSVPELVSGVNALFNGRDPFMMGSEIDYPGVEPKSDKGILVIEGEGSPFSVVILDHEEKNPISASDAKNMIRNHIASETARLLNLSEKGKAYFDDKDGRRQLRPGDFAVIVRNHRDAREMRDALKRRGVQSVLAKSGSILSSPVKNWLDLLLRAVYERREPIIRASLSSPFFGFDAAKLRFLSETPDEWEPVLESFRTFFATWEHGGFMPMFSSVVRKYGILERAASGEDGIRNAADALHLSELYHRTAIDNSFGPSELLSWASSSGDSDSEDENRIRLETDDEAAKIITVHASKGLEYPVVFTACGWDSRPLKKDEGIYYHRDKRIVCDLLSDPKNPNDEVTAASIEQRAENLRLFYVALTRASHRCCCYAGRIAGYAESAEGYLFHDEDDAGDNESGSERIIRYGSVVDRIKAMTDQQLYADILRKAGRGGFDVKRISEENTGYLFSREEKVSADLAAENPHRDVRDDWKISSFSYIVSTHREIDDETMDDTGVNYPVPEMSFPAGPSAGNCIHEMFEKIDFKMNDSEIAETIKPVLNKYSIEGDDKAEWAALMIRNVLDAEMPLAGISLSGLDSKSVIKELEFYFPAAEISADTFRNVIISLSGAAFNCSYMKNIAALDFERFTGFLRGFVDLVFEHGGKYYIADWKSNFLGSAEESYGYERMCREMDGHLYTVQALVYTLALHMHLSSRIPEYDYDTHFGGVMYVFIRGVEPGTDAGLWSWRPDKALIAAMESLCIRRTHDRA